MRHKHLTIEENEILVINWFGIRIQHDNENYATSYEIARGLGVSPSSPFRKILNGMVDKGSLEKIAIEKPGRWSSWGYRLKGGTFQRIPKKQRTLEINSSKGKQLVLF